MKKLLFVPMAIAFIVAFSSCSSSSSFESDVRKMADYQCKLQKLMATATPDEKTEKEMEEKYKDKKNDKAMDEQADKIMDEVMEKCK